MKNSIRNDPIQQCFNKSWRTYDRHCLVQNKICDEAIKLLLRYGKQFDMMADVACGTGESTSQLIQQINHQVCYAIDFSEKLLHLAANKLSKSAQCVLADFDQLIFQKDALNLIFCNMGLQWSRQPLQTLCQFNLALNKNGLLIFSLPSQHNFPEIKSFYKIPLMTPDELINSLTLTNFEYLEHIEKIYIEQYLTPYHALRSIKNIGANGLFSLHARQRGLSRSHLEKIFIDPNQVALTYRVNIYAARKIT